MQARIWQRQYFNSHGKYPKIYTDSSGQDFGFKRSRVKALFYQEAYPLALHRGAASEARPLEE